MAWGVAVMVAPQLRLDGRLPGHPWRVTGETGLAGATIPRDRPARWWPVSMDYSGATKPLQYTLQLQLQWFFMFPAWVVTSGKTRGRPYHRSGMAPIPGTSAIPKPAPIPPFVSLFPILFSYRGIFFKVSAIRNSQPYQRHDMAHVPFSASRQPMQKTWKAIAASIVARIATQSWRRGLINAQSLPNRARAIWLGTRYCITRPVRGIMVGESGSGFDGTGTQGKGGRV